MPLRSALKLTPVFLVLVLVVQAQAAPLFVGPVSRVSGVLGITQADFNFDGKLDFVPGNELNARINVGSSNGDGTYTTLPSTLVVGSNGVRSTAAADLDGNGRPDIAAASFNASTVSVLRNTTATSGATPSFATFQSFAVGANPQGIVAGNLSGTALPELVTANAGTVSVLRNTSVSGAISFSAATSTTVGSGLTDIAMGDLDGDGDNDVVVTSSGDDKVYVLPGDGLGGFGAPVAYSTGAYPTAVVVTNLDGGAPDIVVNSRTNITVLLGAGDGTFAPGASLSPSPSSRPTAAQVQDVAARDLDADGDRDIVAATSRSIDVFLANGDATFAPKVTYVAPQQGSGIVNAVSLAIDDADQDGKLDLLYGSYSDAIVTVLAGRGDGSFVAPSALSLPGSGQAVHVADLNIDGKPDLLTGSPATATAFSSFLGNGLGGFSARTDFSAATLLNGVLTTDLDNDGKPDAVGVGSGAVSVRLGNGSGSPLLLQGLTTQAVAAGSRSVAAGDINGDGIQDLVTANRASAGSLSILLGIGNGTFTRTDIAPFTDPSNPRSVAIGHMNNDGNLDLVVALEATSAATTNRGIAVLLGNGDGTVQAPIIRTVTSDAPGAVAIADINADGKSDVAVANLGNPDISVYPGLGTGALQTASATVITGSNFNASTISAGDVDGDGNVDLVQSSIQDYVAVVLGNGTSAGTFKPVRLFSAPAGSTNAAAVGDVNLDGRLDIAAVGAELAGLLALNLNQTATVPATANTVEISELRLAGPNGAADQYVQLANRSTTAARDVGGWVLEGSNGRRVQIPLGRVIPAGGHLLLAGPALSGYSLNATGPMDLQLPAGAGTIPQQDGGVRLLSPTGETVDAVGFGAVGAAYRTGTAIPNPPASTGQVTFVRRFANGVPVHSPDNSADFFALDTSATSGDGKLLGSPRPDGLVAPTNHNDILRSSLFDATKSATESPNMVYTPPADGNPGTLVINRRVTNCTGTPTAGTVCASNPLTSTAQTITRLRFRVTDLTTVGSPFTAATPRQAVLRALPSTDQTYAAGTVRGLPLDAPSPASGGGINATWTATPLLGAGLASKGSINVSFRFAVDSPGSFTFAYNSEDDLVDLEADPEATPEPQPEAEPEPTAVVPDDDQPIFTPGPPSAPSPGTVEGTLPAKVNTAGVVARFAPGRRSTRITRLRVKRLPAGAAVSIACSGRGCPFARKTLTPGSDRLDLLPKLRAARLHPRSRLTVTVAAPGYPSVVRAYRIRGGRQPIRSK